MNLVKFTIVVSVTLLIFGIVTDAYGQKIKDGINEDQVIICVNGHIVELSGNICKVFMADKDHDKSIIELQKDLYKNPQQDTFDMEVLD